ncbi:MAG: restriction endonuclease subunit S [Candidatus Cloacimonadota bacterium]|nr:restriction endonuclease subunit S [Candidatus Cloacimonadota bacterium]
MSLDNNIPKGWVETTLGEVVGFVVDNRGKTPPLSEDEEYELLEVNAVGEGAREPDYSKVSKFVDKNTFETWFRKGTVKQGDVLIPTVGTIGNAVYSKQERGAIAQNLIALRVNENNDAMFLYYFMSNPVTKRMLLKLDIGGVQPSIKVPHLLEMQVLFPLKDEQTAIAKILTAFDDKIELLQAQNKTLETTAQTIFKEWFGKYQIGDELPDGWRVGKLGEVVELFDSKRIPLSKAQREEKKGQYRYFGATSVMDYVDDYLFDGVYLLFAEDGSVIDDNGHPFLQYVWGKFWVNNHTHILKGKNGFSTEMLYVLSKKMRVAGIVNGAVQLKINQKNLLGFEIVIPSDNILLEFDSIIQPLFSKLRINHNQIQALKQTRDTLLPKLMSGALRVNEFKENAV